MLRKNLLIFYYSIFIFTIILNSCSAPEITREMDNKTRFRIALQLFYEKNYDKALESLKIIAYDRGSGIADSVQYFIAECYFNREQFILSASEYRDLLKYHPNSSLVQEARYKVGVSYSLVAPKINLDQNYTIKAIQEFQNFIEFYPTSPKVRDAERMIIELRNKIAKKDFDIAQLYLKMGRPKSALVYFQTVLEKYHDSDFANESAFNIIKIYVDLKKYNIAKVEIDKFLQKYINSSFRDQVLKIKNEIEKL